MILIGQVVSFKLNFNVAIPIQRTFSSTNLIWQVAQVSLPGCHNSCLPPLWSPPSAPARSSPPPARLPPASTSPLGWISHLKEVSVFSYLLHTHILSIMPIRLIFKVALNFSFWTHSGFALFHCPVDDIIPPDFASLGNRKLHPCIKSTYPHFTSVHCHFGQFETVPSKLISLKFPPF